MISHKSGGSGRGQKVVYLAETSKDDWSDLLTKVGSDRDREAFSRLFAHFAPLVKGFLMKGGAVSEEQAEELVQEALIKVWNKADSFDRSKSAASTWIYTIARNCRIDWLRKMARQKVEINAEDLYGSADENPNYASLVEVRNEHHIKENLTKLPPEQLEILTKIYYEGKSHSEVAEELELPLGTVKSRIRLALKKMELRLSPEMA